MAFKLIIGTPINSVPRPWSVLGLPGVMVNAYEILRLGLGQFRGRGLRRALGIGDEVELWIDSGGYQFLSKGYDVPLEKIIKVYREVDADYYVSLDIPPGPRDDPRQRAVKIAKCINNFARMRDKLKDIAEEGRLVPVFHLSTGEALRLQLRAYESSASTAAVGGLIPFIMQRAGRYSRLKALTFIALVRRLWRGRLHALGLASVLSPCRRPPCGAMSACPRCRRRGA